MKRWVETSSFRFYFEEDHTTRNSESRKWDNSIWQSNFWRPKPESVEKGLRALAKYCSEHQYEVKGIVPLMRAQAYEYGQSHSYIGTTGGAGWGIGYGWGIGLVDGFAAILQRIEEISDEEYAQRSELLRQAQETSSLKDQVSALETSIATLTNELATNNKIAAATIEEKRSMFSTKYEVLGVSFPNWMDAEQHVKAAKASVETLAATLADKQAQLKRVNEQMAGRSGS